MDFKFKPKKSYIDGLKEKIQEELGDNTLGIKADSEGITITNIKGKEENLSDSDIQTIKKLSKFQEELE